MSKSKKPSHQNQLIIKDLSYTYANQATPVEVLKQINATFSPGVLYVIRGESGSGKTTLLSLLSALDEVQEGDILYGSKSIRQIGYNNFRLNYVNIVFQSYNLIKYMTGVENVQIAIDFSSEAKNEPAHTGPRIRAKTPEYFLEKVGLDPETSSRLVGKLSGGQQQRVAIARALASSVPIIVADEPTGNLDEDTEKKVIDIFKDLAHEDGKIVILVTHSAQVAHLADEVYRLSRGKLSKC